MPKNLDTELFCAVRDRAVKLLVKSGYDITTQTVVMDLLNAHDQFNLDFKSLAYADEGQFGHDIFGITSHMDRQTGKIGDCFLPRYILREPGSLFSEPGSSLPVNPVDVKAELVKDLTKANQRITDLCNTVNNYAAQLGLGRKVRAEDWVLTEALAIAEGGK